MSATSCDTDLAIDVGPCHILEPPLLRADLALERDRLDREVTTLRTAVRTNRRIGIAIGIVMSRFRVSDSAAFATLRRVSMDDNRKLRDVAEDVIST
ncbi:MAG: ANTAR domain-containing protein, partial [Lapillicoccus sp.]